MPRRHGGHPARRHRCGGFTFLELMVVIAIISLLASIVVVNLDGLTAPTRLDGAGRSLGNQLVALHDTACLKNRLLSLEIDVPNGRWRMIDAPTPTDVPDPRDREEETYYGTWTALPSGVQIKEIAFSASEVVRGENVIVTFNGDGELQPGGFVAFLVHENLPEEEGMSVELSGLTGLVAYHRGKFTAEEVRRAEDF